MRFVCDQDVDVEVAVRLRKAGHEAWTAADAGLSMAEDDELAVYAHDRRAVLLSHDREFSRRRRRWTIGQHIWLKCLELDAAELVAAVLDDILPILERKPDVFITLSPSGWEVAIGGGQQP